MALPKFYSDGTASVANGSTAVTGDGTAWVGNVAAGDYFRAQGLAVRIASVDSNGGLTLAEAWPGAALVDAAYEIGFTTDAVALTGATRELRLLLEGDNLVNDLAGATGGKVFKAETLNEAATTLGTYQGWGDFSIDTKEWPAGTRINTRNGMSWDVVSSGEDFERADGLKLRWVTGKPLVVFAWGQSNMRGVSGQTIAAPNPNPMVRAWNSNVPSTNGTQFNVATLGQIPFATNGANTPAYWFCDELQRRTGRPVYLIVVASGGHAIEAFMNPVDLSNNGWSVPAGNASLFDFMIAQIDNALISVPGSPTKIDYVIGHQGEANREDQADVYAHKVSVFHKRLQFRGNVDLSSCGVILGQIADGTSNGEYKSRHASALDRLQMASGADSIPLLKVVQTHGLSTFDNIHFTAQSQTSLGKRYAEAAFNEQHPVTLDPTNCDISTFGSLGWLCSREAATGATEYWQRPEFALGSIPLSIENNDTMGWCHLTPANQELYFVARKKYKSPVESQFLVEMDVLNSHPSASATLAIGVLQYGKDYSYLGLNFAVNETITSGQRRRLSLTIGSASGSRPNSSDVSSDTFWFSPFVRFNGGGAGAGLRTIFTGMRWI